MIYNLFANKIGVYYTDEDWARSLLNKIIDEMDRDTKERVMMSVNFTSPNMGIYMNDGTCVRCIRANEFARGHKWNKVIVQNTISPDYIEKMIKPCLASRIINEDLL